MTSKADIERRKFIRIEPIASHPIRVDINGENFIEILYVADISEGGIGIHVAHGFAGCKIDELVSFVLDLPLKRNVLLHFSGKIKHVSGNSFGVRFSYVSKDARRAIRQYIASYMREKSLLHWLKYKIGLIQ